VNEPETETVDSIEGLRQAIRDAQSLLIVGNRSKPACSAVASRTRLISTRSLTGIIQYEPSEFTFTALAGTTLKEIVATLAEKNQYLPFDPMLVQQNATIGGTLAAGMSGPGRHRFGGVRDFVLGAQFVAGDGELIQSGGKVVKNAAGFDLPKLLVGSCGRLAAITALTFKVFPRPVELHTYQIACEDHEQSSRLIATRAMGI
jgi:glycolate oxidase FAD binding subunit